MANAVVVPEWLEKLPWAPEFYPTETEFADPIAYISKIEKEATAFGICKIIPPIPKPSKKFVFANLNRSLSKRPELGSGANFQGSTRDFSKSGGRRDNVDEVRAVFTTRQQEVGCCTKRTRGVANAPQPSAQKQVWQSGEVYTLEQFEAKAKVFSRDILGKIEEVSPLVVETLFWKAASEKPIYVEYANDVPGSAFSEPIGPVRRIHAHKARGKRSVFLQNKCVRLDDDHTIVRGTNHNMDEKIEGPTGDGPIATLEAGNAVYDALTLLKDQGSEASRSKRLSQNHGSKRTSGWKLSNSSWNLQVISRSAGSLTRFMLDDIPGVTSPMIYIGMLFSWFAWHVEDHELHSLNFLHFGSPKTWYAIPGEYAFAFEEVIHDGAYADNMNTLVALAILGEKTTILSPEVVTRKGIPCCRLVQNPGEFVVTFPRAYHIGFSHGFNCGEAANFATPEWINLAKEAAVRRTIMDHLPMLSHQQLLYHLTMSFVSRVPISLLPGVRSSRLKNRQKEARELLVKRAFIGDVLESNNLVNDLLQKDSSFRAVYWNSNALLPFGRESISQTEISADTARSEKDGPAVCLKNENEQINLHDQITLHMQIMDDLDIFDLSGDFEISSGTLPCVACGILGFPYMCVVQPSSKASREILPANSIQGENEASQSRKSKPANVSNNCFSVEFDERWNSSCGFLRPRIFCLEHAAQTEELLRPKGGANILVICHSDFQKIKPTASVVAEEMGFTFGYKEVTLDFASIQDLSLINLAVDDEPNVDWTSNLGINLKHFVKTRKNSAAKPMEHKLKLCGLFSDTTPIQNMSKIRWSSRKSRRKRKPSCPEQANACGTIHEKEDAAVQAEEILKSCDLVDTKRVNVPMENPDSCKLRKVNICFQYSRKKYRSKSGELVEGRTAVDRSTDTIFSVPASVQVHHERSETTGDGGESCILTNHECQQACAETTVGFVSSQIRDCAHKESKAEVEGTASTTSYSSKTQLDAQINAQTSEISEVSDAENSCMSAVISPESSINRGQHMENGNNHRGEDRDTVINPHKTFEGLASRAKREDIAKDNSDVPERKTPCVAEGTSDICPDEIPMEIEVSDCKSLEIAHENDTNMKDLPSHTGLANSMPEHVASAATLITNAPRYPKEDHETDSLCVGILASVVLDNRQSEKIDAGVVDANTTSRNRIKGKREVMLLGYNLNPEGFIKSPCEGLRPRIRKGEFSGQRGMDTAKVAKEPTCHDKKTSEISVSDNDKGLEMTPDETYRCNIDHCQMHFKTKAELSRHKQNRCSYEECGKRFSSHNKAVNHQSVHYKEQSFECTWKGCKMTFNSESARTEHMRTHMGTRPYQCNFEGCGLAFRYLAEFSRHRRRTGHGTDGGAAV